MFAPDQIGTVNADPVGDYRPETLLAVTATFARWRPAGWNVFPHGDRWVRVADAAGNPPCPSSPMTPADLDGVRIWDDDERRYGPA